jgi:hypothetical protein
MEIARKGDRGLNTKKQKEVGANPVSDIHQMGAWQRPL